ncbi:hypothetical protein MRX96_031347 [Rhipicephalus microplus]
MSHFSGKNAPNTKSPEATNTEIHVAGFSHKPTLRFTEIPRYATPQIPFPVLLHPIVENMPQYPLATPKSELPASGYHVGVYKSIENHPVTTPLQSDTRPVQRRTLFDISVSVAPNIPPAHEASAYLPLKDFKQQNARNVHSQNTSSPSHLEASCELSCHKPLPQLTSDDLEVLHKIMQVNVYPVEQSPVPPLPSHHNSFSERRPGPSTFTQEPSLLSLPMQTNMSLMEFSSPLSPTLPHREFQQGAQITLYGNSSTLVAKKTYEHTQHQVSYEQSSYAQNARESTSFPREATQPFASTQPSPLDQTSQTSSNVAYDLPYPMPLSIYHHTQSFPDYTPPLVSVHQGRSYIHPHSLLERAIPRGSQEPSSAFASYEHIQTHLRYQNADIAQNPTVAAGLSLESTPRANIAATSSSSNLVYESAYLSPCSTHANSQLSPSYTRYVNETEGNSRMPQDLSLEQAIFMASRPDRSPHAVLSILPSNLRSSS